MIRKLSSASLRGKLKIDAKKLFGSAADFEMSFFESVLSRNPDSTDAMDILAHLYTRKGMYKEGLALDLKLSMLDGDNPIVFYNLACSYSLLGKDDEAMNALEQSVALGYVEWEHMVSDCDLSGLKDDPRFKKLIRKLGAKA